MEVTFDFHGKVRVLVMCGAEMYSAWVLKGENTCWALFKGRLKLNEGKRHIFQFSCQMLICSTQTQGLADLQAHIFVRVQRNYLEVSFEGRQALYRCYFYLFICFKLSAQLTPWEILFNLPSCSDLVFFFSFISFLPKKKIEKKKGNKGWGGSGSVGAEVGVEEDESRETAGKRRKCGNLCWLTRPCWPCRGGERLPPSAWK